MPNPANNALLTELAGPRAAGDAPLGLWDRVHIRIIAIGMLNFLVYTLLYAALGGDAHNGERKIIQQSDGTARSAYFVRGHFIRSLTGREREVSRTLWIYSYIHSISVLLTSGAMIMSVLVFARPHIIATMRDGTIGGRTFVNVFGTIVLLITSIAVILFVWDFIQQLGSG